MSSWSSAASLNFRDVDVVTAIESVAVLTKRTFIVDPRVRGTLTVVSESELSDENLYEVFLTALQMHGFQAIESEFSTMVVPQAKAALIPDLGGSSRFITSVIRIKYIDASEALSLIDDLLTQGAVATVHEASNALVVTDSEAQILRFKDILADVDSQNPIDYDVIQLQQMKSGDLLEIVQRLGILDAQSQLIEDAASNRVIVSGHLSIRTKVADLVKKIDTAKAESAQRQVEVVALEYADAAQIRPILESLQRVELADTESGGEAEIGARSEQGVTINFDAGSNALVIAGSADEIKTLRSVIAQLDQPKSQVLIEAVIAEVSETFFEQISTNLAALGSSGVFLADFTGALQATAQALGSDSATAQGQALGSLAGRPIIGGADIQNNSGILSVIEAIKTDNASQLLSTPSIITLENEEAVISIGKEVPFVTGSYASTGTAVSNPFQTIERREVGTILRVTPKVAKDGSVRLDIEQEVSTVDESSIQGSAITNATTDKKIIDTKVVVFDRQTLVLGGLIGDSVSVIESRVPLLGSLPILGHLFRSSREATERSVLMVFIRPTIIQTASEASAETEARWNIIQGAGQRQPMSSFEGPPLSEPIPE